MKKDNEKNFLRATQNENGKNKMNSRYRKYLKIYFQHIIDLLKEAKHIFIFGPGEAKPARRIPGEDTASAPA